MPWAVEQYCHYGVFILGIALALVGLATPRRLIDRVTGSGFQSEMLAISFFSVGLALAIVSFL